MCFFFNIVETFTPARGVAPFVAIFFFVRCLSICAGRSRTLKLLGFQHLHFDARLQAHRIRRIHWGSLPSCCWMFRLDPVGKTWNSCETWLELSRPYRCWPECIDLLDVLGSFNKSTDSLRSALNHGGNLPLHFVNAFVHGESPLLGWIT